MKKRNVWKDVGGPFELHEDERGRIADVFFRENINHVAIVDSKAGVIRGNHYHKHTIQHVLVTKGSLEYWHKPVNSDEPAEFILIKEGDVVSTPPMEVHALKMAEDNQFIVFSEGLRGGKDYESDTFRVGHSIIQ